MRHVLTLFATTCALAAGPAAAGSLEGGDANWTGFYLGSQIGLVGVNVSPGGDDDHFIAGYTAGYDYDLGNAVLGASLDYDWTNAEFAPGQTVDNIFRVKLRGGYKLGNGLVYGTGGFANADTNTMGDDDGYFVGIGYDRHVTERLSIGGELLYHQFDDFNNTTTDIDATSAQLRTIFRF